MDVFDVFAKITLDTSDYDKNIGNANNEANIFADVLGANLATKAIGLAVDALKKLGEVAVDTFKQAMSSYADYEQLVGGVETLFKDSSDTILAYAEDAYKTAGLTANEYMETVTSFSASLIQSTGRQTQQDLDALEKTLDDEYKATKRHLEDQYDNEKAYWDKKIDLATSDSYKKKLQDQRDEELKNLKRSNEDQLAELKEHSKNALAEAEKLNMASVTTEESLQRAAELANQAIIDMSDNANKMGTDMASIQNAYQGFAKQNYTMLDNLKIGYGGTKSEMERLLTDAENLMKKQGELRNFSVDSYADIVEAIHIVQTEMGITGTTAKEASTTVSGSINQMKSAWHNLVAGLGNEKADLDKLVKDFFDAANNAWDRLKPVAETVLHNMFEVLKKGIPEFIELGKKIGSAILDGILSILTAPFRWLNDITGISDLVNGPSYTKYRASGGHVQAGQAYRVGEFGVETFVPSTSGTIYTANETASMLGAGGPTINIYGDIYDDERSMKNKLKNAVLNVMQEQVSYG